MAFRNWYSSENCKEFNRKALILTSNLAKCREYIAVILMQIVTLSCDHAHEVLSHNSGYKKRPSESKIRNQMEKMLPFFNMKLNNHILRIVLGFLSDTSEVANLKIISNNSRRAIEKCFMYVCTVEKDCFFNSMRLSTISDFDLGVP
jgi:hypothetical protein